MSKKKRDKPANGGESKKIIGNCGSLFGDPACTANYKGPRPAKVCKNCSPLLSSSDAHYVRK